MKRTFKAEGLECANCAAKMERGISALGGVTACSLNFMTGKLVIEAEEAVMDDVVEAARKIIKKLEPGVTLTIKS